MTSLVKPTALPRCFDSLWERIAREDAALGSRRRLAARLRISTHTLQRLLVDGTAPDLSSEQSPYVVSSWVRTLTRIAIGLDRDPAALLESMGMKVDARVRALVDAELSKLAPGTARDAATASAPDLPGFIAALMGAGDPAGNPAIREAGQQMQEAMKRFLVASGRAAPGMAGSEDLAGGKFCRSCMASLSDRHNQGPSQQYCCWCSDEEGRLRPEQEVHSILTKWFMRWQKGISSAEASERARHYMLSMPAWASAFEAR